MSASGEIRWPLTAVRCTALAVRDVAGRVRPNRLRKGGRRGFLQSVPTQESRHFAGMCTAGSQARSRGSASGVESPLAPDTGGAGSASTEVRPHAKSGSGLPGAIRSAPVASKRSRPQASLGSRTGSFIGRRLDSFRLGEEMTMAQSKEPATNERIVRLLEEIKEQLADVSKRQEEMAHDVTRLLKHA